MHPGKGGPDHPGSEGGSQEEAGGDEAGGADEGGEKGAVDGLPPGTWLGQERPMSRPVKQNVDAKERFSHCQRSHAEMKTCNISKSHISGAIFNAEMKICSIS